MPKHGSEIGITAVGASFVMSCVAAAPWIQRVEDATGKGAGEALQAFGKAIVATVIHTWTWWRNGFLTFTAGTSIDGLAVMMLFVVTLISLLVHICSTA